MSRYLLALVAGVFLWGGLPADPGWAQSSRKFDAFRYGRSPGSSAVPKAGQVKKLKPLKKAPASDQVQPGLRGGKSGRTAPGNKKNLSPVKNRTKASSGAGPRIKPRQSPEN